MDFTPITTQEDFDRIIKERLERERKKFADYDEIKKKNTEYEETIATMTKAAEESSKKYANYEKEKQEMQGKLKGYETNSVKMRIAHEYNIPFELANRLSGENEEDIKNDAQTLSKYLSGASQTAPLRDSETPVGESKQEALRAFTNTLINDD